MPDFIVIGAQKAGTTSLYSYLASHPQVLAAGRKEVHFFDLNHELGTSWYRSMFPLGFRLHDVDGPRRRITGEASPYYLFHPLAPARAHELVPDAKLIVLLRDPVERAWSHYRHEVSAGREILPFAEALAAEPARLEGGEDAIRAGRADGAAGRHRTFSYVARGRYAPQLQNWLSVYPRESMLILKSEQMFTAPRLVWERCQEFLGLQPADPPRFDVHNLGASSSLDPQVRARLVEEFREPNRELANLFGDEFTWPG